MSWRSPLHRGRRTIRSPLNAPKCADPVDLPDALALRCCDGRPIRPNNLFAAVAAALRARVATVAMAETEQ